MEEKTFRLLEAGTFIEKYLGKGTHKDERPLLEPRPTSLQSGMITGAQGSALAKQGNTSVLAVVKAELTEPAVERQDEGFLQISLSHSPTSPQYSSGPSETVTGRMQRVLAGLAENGQIVDLKSLNIRSGKWVWCLNCDILCLDCDAGLLDVSLIALVAALVDTKLPAVTISSKEETLPELETQLSSQDRRKILTPSLDPGTVTKLSLNKNLPVCLSFSYYEPQGEGKLALVVDPDQETLEFLRGKSVSIIALGSETSGALGGIHSFGGHSEPLLLHPAIKQCVKLTRWRHKQIIKLIEEATTCSKDQ